MSGDRALAVGPRPHWATKPGCGFLGPPTLALFEAQAAAGNTDLVIKGQIAGREAGFVYAGGKFLPDVTAAPVLSDAQLRALVGTVTGALTFTCVPPGEGFRVGIDRDGDGYADGDEILLGTSPSDPNSHP